jgi:hypothetical protein
VPSIPTDTSSIQVPGAVQIVAEKMQLEYGDYELNNGESLSQCFVHRLQVTNASQLNLSIGGTVILSSPCP